MTDFAGHRIGGYYLTRLLGEGSYGKVYLGERHRSPSVAVKILINRPSSLEVHSYQKEAQIHRHFDHPHIVPAYDFGISGDIPYIIMGYAPGGSLYQQYKRGTRLPLQTVVEYVRQIASALQYAHDRRIIHRDVKPGNILLGENNELLLSDFGVATIAHRTISLSTQKFSGTFEYAAPEQLQGKPRPASDQYALGIITYEWLTGELPFDGEPGEIVMGQMSKRPPSLRSSCPDIPSVIEESIMATLKKNHRLRFANVQDFADDLEETFRALRKRAYAPTLPERLPVTKSGRYVWQRRMDEPPEEVVLPPRLRKRQDVEEERRPGRLRSLSMVRPRVQVMNEPVARKRVAPSSDGKMLMLVTNFIGLVVAVLGLFLWSIFWFLWVPLIICSGSTIIAALTAKNGEVISQRFPLKVMFFITLGIFVGFSMIFIMSLQEMPPLFIILAGGVLSFALFAIVGLVVSKVSGLQHKRR